MLENKDMGFGMFFLNSISPEKTADEEIMDGLEQICVGDEIGFDHIWIAEHNARDYGVVTSSTVYLAAAAAQTKNIKLGTAVVRLPLHHPLQLAEELTLVDVISNGRLYVGVGKGYDKLEFDAYNIDFDQRQEKYDEDLDVLKAALQNERISYKGNFYDINDVPVNPRPIQKPSPPIFVMVSQNDSTIIRAAKEGHSFILGGITNEEARHKINLYKETALASGYSEEYVEEVMSRSGKLLFTYVSETTEKAQEEYKQNLMWYMSERDNRPVFGVIKREKVVDYDVFLQSDNAIIGSPEKVREDIEKFREETGLNNIITWMNVGGQKQENVIKSMNLFTKEVMPHFKKM